MTTLPDSGGYATRIAAHAHAATAAAIAAGRVVPSTQRITDMPTAPHAAGSMTPRCPTINGASVPIATPVNPHERTRMRLKTRFAASPIQVRVTVRCRPTAIGTLDGAAWLTTMKPATARTLNGAMLPLKAGPILAHDQTDG